VAHQPECSRLFCPPCFHDHYEAGAQPGGCLARGSASTSAHQHSLVGSCEVDHGGAASTSRSRSITSIRIAISGRPESSRVKFGTGLVTTAYSRPGGHTLSQDPWYRQRPWLTASLARRPTKVALGSIILCESETSESDQNRSRMPFGHLERDKPGRYLLKPLLKARFGIQVPFEVL
jgi:hypothetical protein